MLWNQDWLCVCVCVCVCVGMSQEPCVMVDLVCQSVRSLVTVKHVAFYYNIDFTENHKLTYLGLPIIEWDSKYVSSLK
jgi:hypothetical protein